MEEGFLDRLISYHWPGNVRELENVIQHALVLGDNILSASMLTQFLPVAREPMEQTASAQFNLKTLKEVEAHYKSWKGISQLAGTN